MNKPAVSVIGTGKLGSTIALAMANQGYPIKGISDTDRIGLEETARAVNPGVASQDPSEAAQGAQLVILAVPDDSIKIVSDRLATGQKLVKGQIVCHCSGFLPSSVLVANKMLGVSIASMHPMASFPGRLTPWENFRGCYFGLEGDAAATKTLSRLVESLECHPVEIPPSRKAIYHLSGVMATNYVAALLCTAARMMETVVSDREKSDAMMASLAGTVLQNIARNGPEGSLSGPIERRDLHTIEGHIEALKRDFPQGLQLYKDLGKVLLDISRKRRPESDGWDEVSRLLDR